MVPDSDLQIELRKFRAAVGRISGWDDSSIEILQESEDPEEAYRTALRNERALKSSIQTQDPEPVGGLFQIDRRALFLYGSGVFLVVCALIALIWFMRS
jgi:hypothetical protein